MLDKDRKESVDKLYQGLMEALGTCGDASMGAIDVLVTVKAFERAIQKEYGKELGLDDEQIDDLLTRLVRDAEQGEEPDPETAAAVISAAEKMSNKR